MTHISSILLNGAYAQADTFLKIFAYSYVRLSTKRQILGDGLRRQLESSRKYAEENNLLLQETTFSDLGISAFDKSNVTKGALRAFINAVESGKISRGSFLIVENLDRLSRSDAMDAMDLLGRLIRLGIRIVPLGLGLVLDEKSIKDPGVLLCVVNSFVRANEESTVKSKRISDAHEKKRLDRDPFAFGQGPGWLRPKADKSGWEPIPDKTESVRKVFQYSANGFGSVAIARIANNESWPVPGTAKNWHVTLPSKLINNRRVLGEFEPHIKEDNKRVPTGEIWMNYYPPIITEDVFNAAIAAAARRKILPKRRDDGYHNIFQGMLKCGHCGATLARKSKSSIRNSEGYAIYTCSDRVRGLTTCSNWNARELEDALIPALMQFVAADVIEGAVQKQARDALDLERAALAQEDKSINNLIGATERIGASDIVAGRIKALQVSINERCERIVELTAKARDPVASVWTNDLDNAIKGALRAVHDITSELMEERERLHQSFIRIVKNIWVWPKTHASVELRFDDSRVFLPLSQSAPIESAIDGLIFLPYKLMELEIV